MTGRSGQIVDVDVAISGGSYAGLAVALGLSRALGHGLRIAIVDPDGSDRAGANDYRAFAIWAGAKAVLEGLGVWPALEAVAQPITTIEISDSALDDGVRPTRLIFDAHTTSAADAAAMVPASSLYSALRDEVRLDRSITWLVGEAVALQAGAFDAELRLSDGRIVRAALCVAADGRNSRIRDAAGIKTVAKRYGQSGIVATVRFSEPHRGTAIQHFLPKGPFAILPLKDNCACITWSSAEDEAKRVMALDDAAFLEELDRRIGGRFGTISLVGRRGSWPLDVRLPRALYANRLVLVGDAAHGVHPIAGQGVNLALRDVAALVESLADSARLGLDLGHASALERYQQWRRFDSTMSAALYDGLNSFFSVDNAVLRAGRGACLSIVDKFELVKRLIIDEASGVTGDLPKLARGELV